MEPKIISPINLYIGMAISGIFSGIGVAVGTYIANKYVLTKTKKIIKTLESKIKREDQEETSSLEEK